MSKKTNKKEKEEIKIKEIPKNLINSCIINKVINFICACSLTFFILQLAFLSAGYIEKEITITNNWYVLQNNIFAYINAHTSLALLMFLFFSLLIVFLWQDFTDNEFTNFANLLEPSMDSKKTLYQNLICKINYCTENAKDNLESLTINSIKCLILSIIFSIPLYILHLIKIIIQKINIILNHITFIPYIIVFIIILGSFYIISSLIQKYRDYKAILEELKNNEI